jgi:hypothetical protein
MKREINKFENTCDSLICVSFETIVLPKLRKAALKLGIDKIDEMNNYYFFTVKEKEFIEREFCELGTKYERFFDEYIRPISNARYLYPKQFKFFMHP